MTTAAATYLRYGNVERAPDAFWVQSDITHRNATVGARNPRCHAGPSCTGVRQGRRTRVRAVRLRDTKTKSANAANVARVLSGQNPRIAIARCLLPRPAHHDVLWEQFKDKRNDRGYLNNVPSALPGFKSVDVRDISGPVNRFRLVLPEARTMSRELVIGNPARYAVSFVNMTDPADRLLWVAGTKATVADTATNEVVAEKAWYAFEPGQGDSLGSARLERSHVSVQPIRVGLELLFDFL